MSKTAFVTGITGQDGAYLAKYLLKNEYEVYGLVRRSSSKDEGLWRLKELDIIDNVRVIEGDLGDSSSLDRAVRECEPDECYNLGAQTFVAYSWKAPESTSDITGIGVVRLLEALRKSSSATKFYQASSSEMFGAVHPSELPITENTPFRPRSPYACAKVFGHYATINWRESYDIFACSGMLFNHESELRGIEFVTRKITDGVARIHSGLAKTISLGNLSAKRDWGLSSDFIQAMVLMLQQKEPDDYVIATNESHSVKEFVEEAFKIVGITEESVWKHVTIDQRYMRPADVPELKGDYTKAKKKLGWEPKVRFKELVKLMVEADIARLEK